MATFIPKRPAPIEGNVVHYVAYNGRHLAAMVTGFEPGTDRVDLVVFTNMPNVNGEKSGGVQFHFNVPQSETPTPGNWHWPEVDTTEATDGAHE